MMETLIALAALLLGALATYLLTTRRHARDRAESRDRQAAADRRATELETKLRERETARREAEAGQAAMKEEFRTVFKALASDTLNENSEVFLKLANERLAKQQQQSTGELDQRKQAIEGLFEAQNKTLEQMNKEIVELEKERARTQGTLTEQLRALDEAQRQLRTETGNLVQALRKPEVRGRWGEIQLRNVVEMAGMQDHVDFQEQETTDSEEGQLRPDMVVKLPGGKNIVVDSKCPLRAFMKAIETDDDEERAALMEDHARQVRDHITKLSRKSYHEQFEPTPEFVVMFVPGESLYSAAIAQDASLISAGVDKKVILASPTTLIALLKTVAYGWKQETVAESARKVQQLGQDLHKRIRTFAGHMRNVGKSLGKAVDAYDGAVGSLERQVLPQARRFDELGAAAGAEIDEVPAVAKTPRPVLAEAPLADEPADED